MGFLAPALPYIGAATGVAGLFGMGKGQQGVSPQMPNDIAPLRQGMVDWLMGPTQAGPGKRINVGGASVMMPGAPQYDPNVLGQRLNSMFAQAPDMNQLKAFMEPFNNMFNASRDRSLAQAKESAGNLTGSGLNNLFGSSLAASLGDEQAQLGNMMLGLRGQELGRNQFNAGQIFQMLMGLGTTGVGAGTPTYQPGFMDYASMFAPAIGSYYGAKAGRGDGGGYSKDEVHR